MPLYDYKCACGKAQEVFLRIADLEKASVICDCGLSVARQISAHIQRDEPTWLPDALGNLQKSGTDIKPIESRCEYKRYLKEHNIVEAG